MLALDETVASRLPQLLNSCRIFEACYSPRKWRVKFAFERHYLNNWVFVYSFFPFTNCPNKAGYTISFISLSRFIDFNIYITVFKIASEYIFGCDSRLVFIFNHQSSYHTILPSSLSLYNYKQTHEQISTLPAPSLSPCCLEPRHAISSASWSLEPSQIGGQVAAKATASRNQHCMMLVAVSLSHP